MQEAATLAGRSGGKKDVGFAGFAGFGGIAGVFLEIIFARVPLAGG
jgi:hypothetical protein